MIYYSHINEDNRIERRQLASNAYATVVVICGSGERVLSLMDYPHCRNYVVVDCNEEAIFLLQLKVAALTVLPVEEYLQFIGHLSMAPKARLVLFERLRDRLHDRAQHFWDEKKALIAKGLLYAGHFERFLQRVRPLTKWWLGKGFLDVFTQPFEQSRFPERRWQVLKKAFSYKKVYQLAGNKDTAFVGEEAQMSTIPTALDQVMRNNKSASSFMAHLIFKGHLQEMPEAMLPPSLQRDVLLKIKQRLLNKEIHISYRVDDLLTCIQQSDDVLEGPVYYSLSDILSFVDFSYLKELLHLIARDENGITGRSFLRNRLCPSQLDELGLLGKVCNHDKEESSGMYQVFTIKSSVPCPSA